ncbi:HAD family hydrolase [Halomonas flagellata]|uniref:HAD family hydrolase n=1 Tax=Halomonas flagellata TaxID=2920385 RepID=UPI003F6B5FDE
MIVLDKTGTLTKGRPELTDLVVAVDFDELDTLHLVASVERQSEHPIAEAIARRLGTDKVVAAGALFPAIGILLSPIFAAVAMAASSICVLSNALRLKGFRPPVAIEADEATPAIPRVSQAA